MAFDSHPVVQAINDPSDLLTDPAGYLAQLVARLRDAPAHWIAWSGALRAWNSAAPAFQESLSHCEGAPLCLAVGEKKSPEQSWADYFASGRGIPSLWQRRTLLARLRSIEHPLPTPFYLPYQLALSMEDISLAHSGARAKVGINNRLAAHWARRDALSHILSVLRPPKRHNVPHGYEDDGVPTVSIALCAYNEADRIPWAIASVLAQSDCSWELLVVDDGSTDSTAATARSCAQHDPRVILLRSPVNRGKAHALNRALAAARGRYLLELDADDWLPPHALLRMRLAMDATPESIGLLTFDHFTWRLARRGELSLRGMTPATSPIITPSEAHVSIPRLYRTGVLRQLGGWTTTDASAGRLFEDVALILQLRRYNAIATASGALYHRVIRRASISQTHRTAYQAWAKQYARDM